MTSANESTRDLIRTLLSKINGSEQLLSYLDGTDFFTAPASIKYHSCYEGGLAQHSLTVYKNMVDLVNLFGLQDKISQNSIIKVALLHELGKINFYEQYFKNEKVDGEWYQRLAYKVKEANDREIYGDIGLTSYIIASRYIAFSDDEITALCNYSHVNAPGTYLEINSLLAKSPLTLLLYMADMATMYIQNI